MALINTTTLPAVTTRPTPVAGQTATHIQDHITDLQSLLRFYQVCIQAGLIVPSATGSTTGGILDLTKLAEIGNDGFLLDKFIPTINFEGISESVSKGVYTFDRSQLATIIGSIPSSSLVTALTSSVNTIIATYLAANPSGSTGSGNTGGGNTTPTPTTGAVNVVWTNLEYVSTSEAGNSLAFNNTTGNSGYGRANSTSQFLDADGFLQIDLMTAGAGAVGLYASNTNYTGSYNTTGFFNIGHNSANNKLQTIFNGVYSEVVVTPGANVKARIACSGTTIKGQYTTDGGTTWVDVPGSSATRPTGTLYPTFWSGDATSITHNVVIIK